MMCALRGGVIVGRMAMECLGAIGSNPLCTRRSSTSTWAANTHNTVTRINIIIIQTVTGTHRKLPNSPAGGLGIVPQLYLRHSMWSVKHHVH